MALGHCTKCPDTQGTGKIIEEKLYLCETIEIGKMESHGEIILYQPDNEVKLEVRLEEETVWLTQAQMAELFQTSKQNVSLHTNNIFKEGELSPDSVVKESLTTAADGKHYRVKYLLKGYSVNQRLNRLEQLQQPYQHIPA